MTKRASSTRLPRAQVSTKLSMLTAIERFIEVVKDSLSHGENVLPPWLGSFIIKLAAKKRLAASAKKTTIIIPEHKIPAFKPARVFMDEVKTRKLSARHSPPFALVKSTIIKQLYNY